MSVDPRFLELMHQEMDGLISDEARAELHAFLEAHPEARRERHELRRLGEALGAAPRLDPPADLKVNVMRGIESAARSEGRSAVVLGPWTARISRWLTGGRPAGAVLLRYGYVAAGGILLGIVISGTATSRFAPGTGTSEHALDPSALVGTIAPREAGPAAPALKTVPMGLPGGTLTATLRPADAGGYTVEFDLKGEDPVEVTLGYEADEVDFRGVAQESRALEGLETGPRSVRWTQAGNHRIAVLLIPREPAASEANVTLELRIRGVLVGRDRLVLPPLC